MAWITRIQDQKQSVGLKRLAILMIKSSRIQDPAKLENINKELTYLIDILKKEDPLIDNKLFSIDKDGISQYKKIDEGFYYTPWKKWTTPLRTDADAWSISGNPKWASISAIEFRVNSPIGITSILRLNTLRGLGSPNLIINYVLPVRR